MALVLQSSLTSLKPNPKSLTPSPWNLNAMSTAQLQKTIEAAFEARDTINAQTKGDVRDAVTTALNLLDTGVARVAEKRGSEWVVNQWLKKAVLLSFRLNDMGMISGAPGGASWWDKVPSKFAGMTPESFKKAAFRAVPGAVVRHSAYIAPNVVLMPSFVNLGAWVGENIVIADFLDRIRQLQDAHAVLRDGPFLHRVDPAAVDRGHSRSDRAGVGWGWNSGPSWRGRHCRCRS